MVINEFLVSDKFWAKSQKMRIQTALAFPDIFPNWAEGLAIPGLMHSFSGALTNNETF